MCMGGFFSKEEKLTERGIRTGTSASYLTRVGLLMNWQFIYTRYKLLQSGSQESQTNDHKLKG